ncbi:MULTISPECIES: TolC family protein [Prochlorococcus]|uniref:TolC family protein n=1 Tax=Prochlorococcus TaxID=1218 RepID=UPI00053379F8|nr:MULTISPECIES: TolC family protein [Prochlorococcus]KGG13279.1 Outer membrane efflux protein precursor [Prochlorococcus sp. MIT 0601]
MRRISSKFIITTLLFNGAICCAISPFSDKVISAERDVNLKVPSQINEVKITKEIILAKEDILNLIKINSKELEIMRSRIEQAKYTLKSEISSWYPNLDVSGTGLPQYLSGTTYNESSADTSSKQLKASLSTTVRWYLVNPSRVPDIAAARDELDNAKIAYEIKLRDLFLEGLKQFFQLQKSNEEVRIAKDSILTSKQSLEEAEIRLDAGIGTKFEVLEAKAQLAKDKQLHTRKLGEKRINQRGLANILNLNYNTNPIIVSRPEIIGVWNTSLEESIINAYSYQKELKKLILDISINNSKANSVLASSQPKLSIFNTYSTSLSQGQVGVSNPDMSNNTFSDSNTIGLQFDWKIFDGGYGKSAYHSRKEKTKELEADFTSRKNQIRKEVEESFYNLEIAKNNINNTFNEVLAAKEALRLALLRLKAGITTQREVVSNQRDLTEAEVNYVVSITDYNSNLIKLRRETGINNLQACTQIKDVELEEKNEGSDSYMNSNTNEMSLPCKELI